MKKKLLSVGNKTDTFLCALENAVSIVISKVPKINFYKMQSSQFALLIFRSETLGLLSDVTRYVFLSWLSLVDSTVACSCLI